MVKDGFQVGRRVAIPFVILFVIPFLILGTAGGCQSQLVEDLREAFASSRGSGGGTDGGAACGPFGEYTPLRLAPAAAGQSYVRCDTLGPEVDWRITLSPDDHFVAARTSAGTVRLLQAPSGRELAQLASPLGQLDAVAFSPDGATLATLSAEMGDVALWRTRDGAFVRALAGPPASTIDATASALAFSSDGKRLATSLGTLFDLTDGSATDWRTGAAVTATLAVNPENLGLGEAIPRLAFSASETRLFVESAYQIGNSPPSTRLSLVDPRDGTKTILFDTYARALNGYALSPDRRLVAVARTAEASVAGFAAGLALYDADTGAPLAADESFAGHVLAFSTNGQRLYTQLGATVSLLDVTDLHVLGSFAWPAESVFLGVSPDGHLVASANGTTTWWNAATGAASRSLAAVFTAVAWSVDGRFGVGTGEPTRLFRLWREPDGAELCAPASGGAAAPPLASLGVPLDASGVASSPDGSIVATDEPVVHAHSSDWTAVHVRAAAAGAELRVFGATPARRELAVSRPSGARLYTRQGADVAAWCR